MAFGFDPTASTALVIYGYPLDGLTYDDCARLEQAIARLGAGVVGAANGDLSETATGPRPPAGISPVTFVVGGLVARAMTAAKLDATTQSATVDEKQCAKGEAAFESARPHIDRTLADEGLAPSGAPGLFLVAAGPLASAFLRGDEGAEVVRITALGRERVGAALDVKHTRDSLAARVELRGRFTLSARYD